MAKEDMMQVTIVCRHPTAGYWFSIRGRGVTRASAYQNAVAVFVNRYGCNVDVLFVYV